MAPFSAFKKISGWQLFAFLLLLAPLSAALQASEGLDLDFGEYQFEDGAPASHVLEGRVPKQCSDPSCFKFYNDQTAPYLIKEWPLVPKWVDTGEFYSGSIPIDADDPSRTLFFVFKPAINASNPKEIVIWLNGGPGCSSLVGFFQENGPIFWLPGAYRPERNPWSWAEVTNMLWVEQPVGVGYTQGRRTAHNEEGIAQEFAGFYKNWQKLFGIENYKTYVTGESYAGRYVPYIASEMLNRNDSAYFDVGGALIYDGTIGSFHLVGEDIPMYDYARANNLILNLNETFLEDLKGVSDKCGWTEWMQKYLTFPPPGHQPAVSSSEPKESCDTYAQAIYAIANVNPCFNPYRITDGCGTVPWDRLASSRPFFTQPYFNRTDVREALHAPKAESFYDWWYECAQATGPTFFRGPGNPLGPEAQNDRSLDPIQGVLPQVIEATNRVLISHGAWDALLLANGTLLSIQNMTWNGELGFQEPPSDDFVVPYARPRFTGTYQQGVMGKQHYERGLMWVETSQAGHLQPQYQPRASLFHLEWLLGRVDSLGG